MRSKILIFIIPAMLMLTGCPVGMEYPLGEYGKEKIDEKLIGTWVNNDKSKEAQKVIITANDNLSYTLKVVEKSEDNYMIDATTFKAWITTIDSKKFLVPH